MSISVSGSPSLQTLWQQWNDAPPNRQERAQAILNELSDSLRTRALALKRRHQRITAIEVEDLIQDATVAILECLERYDPTKALFTTYVFAVMDGALCASVSDAYEPTHAAQSRKRDIPLPSVLNQCLEAVENAVAFEQALAKLACRPRQIIRLRYFESRTQAEVAKRLNISQQRVAQIEAGALKDLKYWLTEESPTA